MCCALLCEDVKIQDIPPIIILCGEQSTCSTIFVFHNQLELSFSFQDKSPELVLSNLFEAVSGCRFLATALSLMRYSNTKPTGRLTKIRMSTVNVDVDCCNLFFGPGLSLEGEIKRIVQDFEVRELHLESIDSPNDQSSSKARNNDGYVDHVDDVTVLHGMDYLKKVRRESKKTVKLNDRRRVAIQLPMKMSKKERRIFHVAVKDAFSYILTAAMSIGECTQDYSSSFLTDSAAVGSHWNVEEQLLCYTSSITILNTQYSSV